MSSFLKKNTGNIFSKSSYTDYEGASSSNQERDWPIDLEFSNPKYESDQISIDTSIWKSIYHPENEMPSIISEKMMKSHKSKVDAWMVIREEVWDVSGFLDRHPGGFPAIKKGIGKDATELFEEIHPTVNIPNQIGVNFIGIYMPHYSTRVSLKNKSVFGSVGKTLKSLMSGQKEKKPKFNIFFNENDKYIVLKIKATRLEGLELGPWSWTLMLWNKQFLMVKIQVSPGYCWTAEYALIQVISVDYLYYRFKNDYKTACILLKKPIEGDVWDFPGYPTSTRNGIIMRCDEAHDQAICHLFYRCYLTPNVILVGFKVRPSSFFGIPPGYYVRLSVQDVNVKSEQWHCPVVFSLLEQTEPQDKNETGGQSIYLMLRLAESNHLTSRILTQSLETDVTNDYNSLMRIGSANGTFEIKFLEDFDVLVLLAKDLGVIPMIKIIQHYKQRDRTNSLDEEHIFLLYFNENKEDVIWRKELSELNDKCHWFHLFLFLSHPDSEWKELQGDISIHIVKSCLNTFPGITMDLKIKAVAAGDLTFLRSCARLFRNTRDYFDETFVFRGPPKSQYEYMH